MKPIEVAAQLLNELPPSERKRILDILIAREKNGRLLRQIAREREARVELLLHQQSRRSGVGASFM